MGWSFSWSSWLERVAVRVPIALLAVVLLIVVGRLAFDTERAAVRMERGLLADFLFGELHGSQLVCSAIVAWLVISIYSDSARSKASLAHRASCVAVGLFRKKSRDMLRLLAILTNKLKTSATVFDMVSFHCAKTQTEAAIHAATARGPMMKVRSGEVI